MTAEAVTHEDIISAVLGASSALTGLALVFLGFAITTLQSYDAETPSAVLTPHRSGVWTLLAALVAGIGSVVASMGWLLTTGEDSWFAPTIGMFIAELATTLAGSTLVVVAVLRK